MNNTVPLTDELCAALMKQAGARERTAAHCRTVAGKALAITDALNNSGCSLDRELIYHAALLHDIARAGPNHAKSGGRLLTALGYPEVGEIVSLHHDILPVEVSEAAVLSLADRYISGVNEVSIEERFARSAAKCTDPAARAAHEARYSNAIALEKLFEEICGSYQSKNAAP